MDAIADAGDRGLGRETGAPAFEPGDFAGDLANGDASVGSDEAGGWRRGDLELVVAIFGNEVFGLAPRLIKGGDELRTEGIGMAQRREREGRLARPVGVADLEFLLEGSDDAAPRLFIEIGKRALEKGTPTSYPGLAIELDDIAHHEVERRCGATRMGAISRFGIGQKAQVAR
jgi:hypothetical protein